MMLKSLYSLTWMMGLLLAPHALTLVGNFAGGHQPYFFIWLALAAGLHWNNARSLNQLKTTAKRAGPHEDNAILVTLLVTARTITTVTLSTVLLVTAGFVFNETFVYWFPNFAFAFIVLGVVLAVNLWGRDAAGKLQIAATGIVLVGLVSLIFMGLGGGNTAPAVEAGTAGIGLQGIATALLLFVGFDLAIHQCHPKSGLTVRYIQWGIMATAMIMGLWGWVCLRYVPAAKLSDSFVPHLLTARQVYGDIGRAIMGTVVIAGSVAAVNVLIKSLADLFSGFAGRQLRKPLKSWLKVIERPAVWHMLIAAVIGLMMARGVAGTDEIDLYVRAGLILWVLYYGGVNFSILLNIRRIHKTISWRDWALPLGGAVAMFVGGTVLIVADPNSRFLFKLFVILGIVVAVMAIAGFFRRRGPNYEMK